MEEKAGEQMDKRNRCKRERRSERKERDNAGPAMGRYPLTKRSAWDMAFTKNSQMPWQLIRALNASCINTPCSLMCRSATHTHTPEKELHIYFLCFHEKENCVDLVLWLVSNLNIISN